MEYTIGQVSKMFGLPVSTLRYYDKEGLLPEIKRSSGIRKFGEKEMRTLKLIECLKKSGLEIKQIKQFIEWCDKGSETYPQRKRLFEEQQVKVLAEIEKYREVLCVLKFKAWYYEELMKEGGEQKLANLSPNNLPQDMPSDIKEAYLTYIK